MESSVIRRPDPLGLCLELPFTGAFHPLGFPLEIATNSRLVIDAAQESWADRVREFDASPLMMRVRVTPEGALAEESTHSMHGHLYAAVSDAHNFAYVDLAADLACVQISEATAADRSRLRWLFVESLAYLMLCQRRVAMIHAGCVARSGAGVLLCGPSKSGKSTLSYACARAGWTWISDDCACLLPDTPDPVAIGRSRFARLRTDAARLFPELATYEPQTRPTGTVAIEVEMAALAGIVTADRAGVEAIAFLERAPGRARAVCVGREDAIDRLLADTPSYGPEVDAMHERAVRAAARAPAFQISYDFIEDGVRLLSGLL
jgi:hypothetical protein